MYRSFSIAAVLVCLGTNCADRGIGVIGGTSLPNQGSDGGGSGGSGGLVNPPTDGSGGSAGEVDAGGSGGAASMDAAAGGTPEAPPAMTGDMRSGPFKMLVFSWTRGFRHTSIEAAQQMAKDIGADNPIAPFTIDIANAQPADPAGACRNKTNALIPGCVGTVSMFNDENLKKYEIIFFANPTGDDFSSLDTRAGSVGAEAKAAFERYINNGGAYIGVHSASDFEKGNWTFYGDMLGALLDQHDFSGPGTIVIQDLVVDHPVVRGLPKMYQTEDEWYMQQRNPEGRPGITILAKLARDRRPLLWVHEYPNGGRVVYTTCGHDDKRFSEPWMRQVFLQGVMWAVHRLK